MLPKKKITGKKNEFSELIYTVLAYCVNYLCQANFVKYMHLHLHDTYYSVVMEILG